jgi:hypothetical protein
VPCRAGPRARSRSLGTAPGLSRAGTARLVACCAELSTGRAGVLWAGPQKARPVGQVCQAELNLQPERRRGGAVTGMEDRRRRGRNGDEPMARTEAAPRVSMELCLLLRPFFSAAPRPPRRGLPDEDKAAAVTMFICS